MRVKIIDTGGWLPLRSYLKLEQLGNSILMNTGTVSKADSTLFHRSPSAAGGSHGPYGLNFLTNLAVASETRLSYFASDLLTGGCHYAEFLLVSQEECDETRN